MIRWKAQVQHQKSYLERVFYAAFEMRPELREFYILCVQTILEQTTIFTGPASGPAAVSVLLVSTPATKMETITLSNRDYVCRCRSEILFVDGTIPPISCFLFGSSVRKNRFRFTCREPRPLGHAARSEYKRGCDFLDSAACRNIICSRHQDLLLSQSWRLIKK